VTHVLKLVDAEMRVAMALTGITKISQIDEQLLDRSGNQATF
jgi:isopentenyl diphosphate isomerase/L-lactate dehydrogenase-like FMN-dependent dehydrogenase